MVVEVGNVPKLRFPEFSGEWGEGKLGNICEFFSGGTPSVSVAKYYGGTIPFIKSGDIHSTSTTTFITDEGLINSSAKLINQGDLIYALYGATSGEVGIAKIAGAINQAVVCIRSTSVNIMFLCYLLIREKQRIVGVYLQGGQGNLSSEIIRSLTYLLPSLPEQTKIANFLTLFDKKIDKQSEKVAALEEYKKGLMQKIFSREIRFKDDEGKDYPEWEIKKAKKLFYNISDKNHNGDLEVLSVTQDRGTVIRKELSIDIKYDRANLKNYKRVKRNNFIISLRSFQGGIDRSSHDGLVSPAYTIFDLTEPEMHDPRYYGLLFKSKNYINRLNTLIYGIRDGKAIGFNDFSELPIHYPSKFEQTKIANFLTLFDRKIEKEKAKLEALREQKKGLLQQMFV